MIDDLIKKLVDKFGGAEATRNRVANTAIAHLAAARGCIRQLAPDLLVVPPDRGPTVPKSSMEEAEEKSLLEKIQESETADPITKPTNKKTRKRGRK